ncbi:MAG: hypothetical protein ACSLFP_14390, partial [Acidimicrobiales bacterium]
MSIDRLLDITLAVPDPDGLAAFWARRGLLATDAGVLGTSERPRQLVLREGPYRHLAELHLGCADEADLKAIARRLDALGVASQVDGTTLTCADPVFDHHVIVEVTGHAELSATAARPANGPGRVERTSASADVVEEAGP